MQEMIFEHWSDNGNVVIPAINIDFDNTFA
jgi:hypothetical protein